MAFPDSVTLSMFADTFGMVIGGPSENRVRASASFRDPRSEYLRNRSTSSKVGPTVGLESVSRA